jgi:transcriptional regulator GlxA family with amidase domain
LPRLFRTRLSAASQAWLSELGLVGVSESGGDTAGRETILLKLAELMLVEIIRQYVSDLSAATQGWLAGLRDHHIGAALQVIHQRPAETWTLESLARHAGLSRSAFAERFADYVGMPAIQYVARWRLQLAARLLDDPAISMAQAAAEVGYESEAAFHRAFKRHVGTPPGAWRRARTTRGPVAALATA